MNAVNKRKDQNSDDKSPKRMKKSCSYGDKCYRRNPAHLREFSHPHLEAILDAYSGSGPYPIPAGFKMQQQMIKEQLEVIVERKLYEPVARKLEETSSSKISVEQKTSNTAKTVISDSTSQSSSQSIQKQSKIEEKLDTAKTVNKTPSSDRTVKVEKRDTDYRPIVPPTRQIGDYFKVVLPRGKMAAKHAASAPYHIFYTTITDSKATHNQPYSITLQAPSGLRDTQLLSNLQQIKRVRARFKKVGEILDPSLGELKSSLQINFMIDIGWLLAHYYFAGYSEKKLTILYGEECSDIKNITQKKPHVDAHYVSMPTPFGKHHTKMMILCYEDGSLRVVISTANLYIDDWENRTQGLWFSPRCPELPPEAMPHEGESPTLFKKYLLKYLHHYHLPQLTYYVERVKRCDFTHINVFLISSAPGSHFDTDWGMTRVGSLLRQHCAIPQTDNLRWPLIAQASSLGSYGKEPKLWLTGDFLHYFTKIKNQSQLLSQPPEIKLIYPSLENVQQSHDGLLGGGCLPYAADAHTKQMWLNNYLFQWKAKKTFRDKAMPHIKSYTRISPDNKWAAYFLLTSGNVSKAAWGQVNKGNQALRLMSYECGVLFLPKFVINEDMFPLEDDSINKLTLPYDIPPIKYASDMSPWVSDYLS